MTDWLATILIFLPLAGAVFVWLLPVGRIAGPIALLFALAELGVFASHDVLLFCVFFEAMMIPLYLLIGVWGGPGRLGATVKFVIYTMAGSLLMLASVIVFGLSEGSFDLVSTGTSDNTWIF